ncbi:Uncharacterised protein [Mycobacteroides abscessus subsp. abscessus]|nr:Uncharacterised protein [Mycobacteroides abscessus subsp. abscessus]
MSSVLSWGWDSMPSVTFLVGCTGGFLVARAWLSAASFAANAASRSCSN